MKDERSDETAPESQKLTQKSEIGEFAEWLVGYAEQPMDETLIHAAEQRDLSVATLLSLGHGAALTAVTGKVKEILRARSSAEERSAHIGEGGGSIPPAPTNDARQQRRCDK